MSINEKCGLCLRPNIYFDILAQRCGVACLFSRSGFGEENKGVSETELLKALIRLADKNYSPYTADTLTQYLSRFKAGNPPKRSEYIPFNKAAFRAGFEERMATEPDTLLSEMIDITHKFLDHKSDIRRRQLVGTLLELIECDGSFDESDVFIINNSGKRVAAPELYKEKSYDLEPFLLSLWYNLLTRHYDCFESSGTYDELHCEAETENSPRPLDTFIGLERAKKIAVSSIDTIDETNTATKESTTIGSDEDPIQVNIDDSDSSDSRNQTTNQIINNGLLQQAEKIVNAEHIDTLIL